jgi:methionyl-tRNA formyltransferase
MLYDSIRELVQAGHEAGGIITSYASPEYQKNEEDFLDLAGKIGCLYLCTENLNDPSVIETVKNLNPDVAISINWKSLVGEEFIRLFPYGMINAHAGDLPQYRGNAVPNWAIINGESQIVLTLHQMNVELDAGPVLLKKPFVLTEDVTIGEVYRFLRISIPAMYVDILRQIDDKTITPLHQSPDPKKSSRCYPRLPRDSEINWAISAEEIHRLVRAVSEPFSGAYTHLDGRKLTIWRAGYEIPDTPFYGIPGQIAQRDHLSGEVRVVTGQGFLILKEVELAGSGSRKKPANVITTIRTRLGMDLSYEIEELKKRIDILEKKKND